MRIAKTITTIFISVFLLFLFSRQIYATCQGVFSCQLDICCPSGLCPPVCTAYDHYTIQCSHFPDSGHCVSDKTDECIAHSNPYDVDWYVVVDNCSWDAGCIRNCSCAANTCVGYFCSDGCGGWCAGTKSCGGCTPNCSCASDTCEGDTCTDPVCGIECEGTKNCECDYWGWHVGDCGGCAYVDTCCAADERNRWRWNTCSGWEGECNPDETCVADPVPTLIGRIHYDANHNRLFEDGPANFVEDLDNIPPDCTGVTKELRGLLINYSGAGSGSIDHHTACNSGGTAPYYTAILPALGTYTLTLTLPAGYELRSIGSTAATDGTCTLSSFGSTVTCNLTQEMLYDLHFLIDDYCTVSISPSGNPYEMPFGSSQTFTAFPAVHFGSVGQVSINSSNGPVLDPDSVVDINAPYQGIFTATGAIGSSTTLTANVFMSGQVRCSTQTPIVITNPPAWWQVDNADVFSKGDIDSGIYLTYFDIHDAGGFPGVPFGASIGIDADLISDKKWNAIADYNGSIYDYSYFKDKVESEYANFPTLTGSIDNNALRSGGYRWPASGEYYWYKAMNGLTIDGNTDIGTNWSANRKVIIFVESGDVAISRNVNINKGKQLFMVIAGDDIALAGSVGQLDGVYVTDKTFQTGSYAQTPPNDLQLTVNGSIVGWNIGQGGSAIILQRDMLNNTIPAEKIIYSPAQIMQIPSVFGKSSILWKEVAP